MVFSLKVEKPISAMACGTYGREENSLVIVHGQVSGINYAAVFSISTLKFSALSGSADN